MKFIKNVLKFFKKNEEELQENNIMIKEAAEPIGSFPDYAESKKIIETALMDRRFFEIGNLPCVEKPVFSTKYIGGFINAENGVLTLGVCTDYGSELIYKENNEIILAYPDDKELFLVTAKIESMRQMGEDDFTVLREFRSEPDFADKIKNYVKDKQKLNLIIVNLCILTEPRRHQRRYHFRVAANWIIHFKIIKPDAALSFAQKRWITEKIFESENDLLKIKTVDVSTGGFKSTVKKRLPAGIYLECIIEINGSKIDSRDETIVGKVLDCSPSRDKNELFELRVQFTQMPGMTKEIVTNKILLELNKNKA